MFVGIFTIPQTSTVLEAIDHFVTQQLASLLAVTASGEIAGVLTARDVLRIMHKYQYNHSFELKVEDVMTKKEKMVRWHKFVVRNLIGVVSNYCVY